MSNSFNIARTATLLRLFISEHRRSILLGAAMLAGVFVLAVIVNFEDNNYDAYPTAALRNIDPGVQDMLLFYILTFIIAGTIVGSILFPGFNSRQGRLGFLMVPANASEKLISRLIVGVILFPIAFWALACAAECLRGVAIGFMEAERPFNHVFSIFWNREVAEHCLTLKSPWVLMTIIMCGGLALQSFFILGATVWTRAVYVKTFIVFGALALVYLLCALSVAQFGPKIAYYPEPTYLERYGRQLFIGAELAACLFNWTIAWLRLRELDVITTKR